MSERVWTEAKLKADEMLAAVDSAMQLVGDKIDLLEKNKILKMAEELRSAIGSNNARELKKATAALDDATQDLAAMVVERALGAANQGGLLRSLTRFGTRSGFRDCKRRRGEAAAGEDLDLGEATGRLTRRAMGREGELSLARASSSNRFSSTKRGLPRRP